MAYSPEPRRPTAAASWRWKPVDIVVLVLAFAMYWPLGIAFLVWKLWNDRQDHPQDLGALLQLAYGKLQDVFEAVTAPSTSSTRGEPALTGNPAFDAHIREQLARVEADRRGIDDEIAAFRAFLATERAGDTDVFERFRNRRGDARMN